jgi:acyl-CoA synthetase (AMP-forming)/AMP-acid ligase II
MKKVKEFVLRKYFKKYFEHNIAPTLKNPAMVQQEVFRRLIEKASQTEFGKKYSFEDIRTVKDFQSQVPISEYEDLKPYIKKIMNGETDVLWPGEIKVFAKSAGTTSNVSKYIPVPQESLVDGHYKGGKDVFALYANRFPETGIFQGKILSVAGSIESTKGDTKVGDVSALIVNHLPWWAELSRVPGKEVTLIKDWNEKLDVIIESCKDQDVRAIAGVPSWIYVILKTLLEQTGASRVKDVWPNFEVCFYGGMAIDPYRKLLLQLESDMRFSGNYNAADAFLGGQYNNIEGEILLSLDNGVFYEFITMDSFYSENRVIETIDTVKKDVEYAIVLSTNGGLWRYVLGDTVMFTSLEPRLLKITGRTKQFINISGEEVVVSNAEEAISKTQEKIHCVVKDFTVAPIFAEKDSKNSAHQWLIEFETTPSDIEMFTDTLDSFLMEVNSDYKAKRYADMLLRRPVVTVLPEGTVLKWFESKGKMGGQNKLPRLANNRQYVDEILELAGL